MSKLWNVGKGTGKYSTCGPKENIIVNRIIRKLKEKYPRAFIVKIHGGGFQRAGLPDIYMCYKGYSFWLEVKRPNGDTTALQKHTMEQLIAAGAFVGVITSPQEGVELIEEALKEEFKYLQ